MYKTFLSWRYLVTRRTNLIGIVGIFVAVAALIMILSIMTGFLEQTKAMVRGGLSDMVVLPPTRITQGPYRQDHLHTALDLLREDERIVAASPRLTYYAMLGLGGSRSYIDRKLTSDPTHGGRSVVEVVGVDSAGEWRLASSVLAANAALQGFNVEIPEFQDEQETSGFGPALRRDPHEDRPRATPVPFPEFPFTPPRGYMPDGRPKVACIVGEQLFHSLYLSVGDEITLVTMLPTEADEEGGGGIDAIKRAFVIAGTFRTQDNEMDGGRIYVPRAELADMLNDGRDYTEIVTKLVDFDTDAVALKADLETRLGELNLLDLDGPGGDPYPGQIRTWEDFRASLIGAIQNERVLMAIMLSLILVVAGFTIFSILTMMVTEKRRDIGILAAVGATPNGVLCTFLLIGFWNALLGSLLGCAIGVLGAIKIDTIEQWLSRTLNIQIFNRDVYYFDTIPSRVEPLPVTLIVGGAFLCTLMFAAIPAWRAGRLHPLEALRYE